MKQNFEAPSSMTAAGFDQYADSYDADLHRALSASGEDKDYFARGRIQWVMSRLASCGTTPASVLDYGCGTGSATPFFLASGITRLLGVDISERSIDFAISTFQSPSASFRQLSDGCPSPQFDLAYTNGVFHHIPPAERADALRYIWQALRPGGHFALWENNPWNPGTRYVMSNCVFDRDAIMLSPPEARSLVRENGFKVLETRFLFIFPRPLSWLRFMEPALSALPLGGQYVVLCQKSVENA